MGKVKDKKFKNNHRSTRDKTKSKVKVKTKIPEVVEEIKETPKKVNKAKKPPKKKLIVKPIEKEELEDIIIEIKKTDSYPKEHLVGRKTNLLIMYESGEDKIIAQKIFILASKGHSRQSIIKKPMNIQYIYWL